MTTVIEEFDAATALRLLKEAVEERGSDFRWNDRYDGAGCDYTAYPADVDESKPVEPACLIGVALFKAGWDLTRLNGLNGDIDDLVASGDLQCTDVVRQMWMDAQYCQDQNGTWGEALERATEIYKARRGEE